MLSTGILICCTGPFCSSSLCLFGFCLPVSSVPNFRPETGRRRWSLTQVASSVTLQGGTGAAFPVYTSQAPGCSLWSMPCIVCTSSFWVFHKSADSVAPAFCAFPTRAAQAARSLTGALDPGAVHLLPSVTPASVSTRASLVHVPCV